MYILIKAVKLPHTTTGNIKKFSIIIAVYLNNCLVQTWTTFACKTVITLSFISYNIDLYVVTLNFR